MLQITRDDVPAGRIKASLLKEELAAAGITAPFVLNQGDDYLDGVFEVGGDDAQTVKDVIAAHDPNKQDKRERKQQEKNQRRAELASVVKGRADKDPAFAALAEMLGVSLE